MGMRVGVVGAGITGLATMHYLRERDVDVVAFEATDRPGGVIRTREVDGHVLEYGPQRLRLSGALAEIVDDISLNGTLQFADGSLPLYVYADGALRRVPRSIGGFLRTDALSLRGKLRVLLEPLTGRGNPEERAGELLERKFGREAYRTVIEPLLAGVYASDPMSMPSEYALGPVLEVEKRHRSLLLAAIRRARGRHPTPPVISFEGGLESLPQALYEAHADRVRLNDPVHNIERSDRDGRFTVEAENGSEPVDSVVVTVPAPRAGDLLDALPGANVGPLRSLRYSPLAIVHLRSDTHPNGFGYQVRRDEGFETLGVTWNDSLFDRDEVYTAFLGGTSNPGIAVDSPDDIGRIAAEEFEAIMGAPATVLEVTTLEAAVPSYDSSWARLETLEVPDGVTLATNYTGRIGVPSRVREAKTVAERLS